MSQTKFSIEFKLESAGFVLDQGYSIAETCSAPGVGATVIGRWGPQLKALIRLSIQQGL